MAVNKTVRKEDVAVLVRVRDGEHLVYKITVLGAQPIFTLVDQDSRLLMSQDDSSIPQMVYTRRWPNPTDNPVKVNNDHTMALSFLAAIKYTYLVEHRRSDDSVKSVIIDVDYESQRPEDTFFQNLGVITH